MPESLSKVLLIAGSAALTCFVIGLLVYAGGQGGALASAVVGNTAGITDKLTNSDIKQYSDNVVTGAEVLNAIRNYQDQMSITVTTLAESGAATDTTYTGTERIENVPYLADGSANTKYINPYAKFNSSVSVNANGVSSGLVFAQRSYVALADTGQLVGDGSSTGSGNSTGSGTSGGGSTGVDYATLQDVVNSQSAAIADLATMLESSNAGNSATLDALKDQLAQLSTEQSELSQAMADMKVSIEDLQDLSVKIDALEGQISSIGGDGGVFDQDGTFTFRAGKTYYLSAIACGGTGGTGYLTDYFSKTLGCANGSCYNVVGYNTLASGAGGSRGQYVIRKKIKFDKDTQAAFIIGTNGNNGNTVITFETGEVITLIKGGGGGGAASQTVPASTSYGATQSVRGSGGAGGFYKTTMKDFVLVNGSGSKGGNGVANVTTAIASYGSTASYSGYNTATSIGGEGGYGYGAGGGGGASAAPLYTYSLSAVTYGYFGTGSNNVVAASGGQGAPGVVIIETD